MQLVAQMHEEQRRQQARANREILQGLSRNLEEPTPELPRPDLLVSNQDEPSSSIHLDVASSPAPRATPPIEAITSSESKEEESERSDSSELQQGGDLGVLRSLFQLADDVMQPTGTSSDTGIDAFEGVMAVEGDDHFLPSRPDALLQWMQSIDLALSRHLRNFSHALNVQMLRSGQAQALLPITLLEAVLRGQMETQPTASNVLRLRLPLATGDRESGMDVFGILLRISELEFDSHRLRRCRARLCEHHRALITMVRQQRHWERRFLDREARKHWQTSSDSTTPKTNGD
ncbi:hypothetical protein CREGCYN_11440 [Synechococcus sp. M16CYN]